MKNIKRPLLALALLLAFTGIIAAAPSSSVSALTKDQKRACQVWAGNYASDDKKIKDLKKDDCYSGNGGNCTISTHPVPNEDGTQQMRSTVECPLSKPAGSGGSSVEGCGSVETSIIKCDSTTGGNPVLSMLLAIINFLAVGVGIAVVGGIIWGGLLYASSNGDAAKVKQGKTVIINAVVGLLLFIFMYALMNFLIPGGLFA